MYNYDMGLSNMLCMCLLQLQMILIVIAFNFGKHVLSIHMYIHSLKILKPSYLTRHTMI